MFPFFSRPAAALPVPAPAPADAGRSEAVELARQAAGGDAVATRKVLENVAPRVTRAVRACMGPWHPDVDDAVQLSLIGFIQALPSFRGDCNPALFATRIAVRTANAVRRRSRARQSGRENDVDLDSVEGDRLETGATRRREAVRALLDELPEEQAEALALRFMLGWSLLEIAEASGAPSNTVRSRLRLAKEALRRRIEADPTLAEELAEDEATR